MMVEREDLGLSLSLGAFSHHNTNHHPKNDNNTIQLSLMPSLLPTSSSSPHSVFNPQKPYWFNAALPSSDRNSDTCRAPAKSHLRGIDVNRPPSGDCDDVSSPNSTVSSVSGKRSERDTICEDLDLERDGLSDEEFGENSRKKLRLSKDQSAVLEVSFKEHNTLNPKQKLALAKQLGLRPRQVEVWFQNRRARTKLKQTEVDFEFLKRCCGENLTEENRRLQKEVNELRSLKLSPQFYMQMVPPTTLTMCPSCERVAVPQASTTPSSATALPRAHHHPMVPVLHPRAMAGAWPNVAVAERQQRQFGPFRVTRT